MLPKDTSKVFLTFTPKPGPVAEEPIGNRMFLSSFLEDGVWMRVAAAHCHLKVLQDSKATRIQRLGSLAAFYQQIGLSVEDALTNLVAWSVWSIDKNKSIADLMEQIVLRFGRPTKSLGDSYIDEVRQRLLSTTKRVDIYPREYLAFLLEQYPTSLPQQLGIPWKRHPSVKLVPKEVEPFWTKLPEMLHGAIEPLTKPRGDLLAACYNKLKHGPQAVFMSPVFACIARGHPDDLAQEEVVDEPAMRLLLDGSRTQETVEELTNGERIAPFLIDDSENATRFFFQVIVHNANMLSIVGTWIFNSTYPDTKRDFKAPDSFINSLVAEQGRHLGKVFPSATPFGM